MGRTEMVTYGCNLALGRGEENPREFGDWSGTTYNKIVSKGWSGEEEEEEGRKRGRGKGGKEYGVVGVQQRPGIRRSLELGAQTPPLRCRV